MSEEAKMGKYKFTIEDVKSYCKEHGIQCISEYYKNVETKITLVCNKCGNQYETNFRLLKASKSKACSDCSGNKRYTIYDVHEISKSIGLVCISETYKNNRQKLEFICSDCGEVFRKTLHDLTRKKVPTCPDCSQKRNWDNMRFKYEDIKIEIESMGGIIISNEYVNSKTKLELMCPECSESFNRPFEEIKYNKSVICGVCAMKKMGNDKVWNMEKFLHELEIRNQKIFSELKFKGNYINNGTPIYADSKFGEVKVIPNSVLAGYGFDIKSATNQHEYFLNELKCKNRIAYDSLEFIDTYSSDKHKMRALNGYGEVLVDRNHLLQGKNPTIMAATNKTNYWINQAIEKQGCEKLDYSLVDYINIKHKVIIICKLHGEFDVAPNNFLQGQSCPVCNHSRGEDRIYTILKANNIEFKTQYKFDGCVNKKRLPFDFYIPSINMAVEYQGGQHYFEVEHFGGLEGFKKTKRNDSIKKRYCVENKITLLEIPYWDFNNIDKILIREVLNHA
jgi:DNA-directed RNA polymerase subunit RPC12/RpoP